MKLKKTLTARDSCSGHVASSGEAEEDGYDDEYALEDVEIAASDYIKPTLLGNFRAAWEGLPQEAEVRWPNTLPQPWSSRGRDHAFCRPAHG
jgi:hypothetical protein